MLDFRLGLQGFFGSLQNDKQVKVAGFSDNYLIRKSFPLLVGDNSFSMVYLLQNVSKVHLGLYAPEAFLSLADEIVALGSAEPFNESNLQLYGAFGSFADGSFVKLKDGDKIYKVAKSFLMLNSASNSIICYELTDLNDRLIFYCPHSFLVRSFAPDALENSGPGGGGPGGDGPGGDGPGGDGPGHGDGSGFYG